MFWTVIDRMAEWRDDFLRGVCIDGTRHGQGPDQSTAAAERDVA